MGCGRSKLRRVESSSSKKSHVATAVAAAAVTTSQFTANTDQLKFHSEQRGHCQGKVQGRVTAAAANNNVEQDSRICRRTHSPTELAAAASIIAGDNNLVGDGDNSVCRRTQPTDGGGGGFVDDHDRSIRQHHVDTAANVDANHPIDAGVRAGGARLTLSSGPSAPVGCVTTSETGHARAITLSQPLTTAAPSDAEGGTHPCSWVRKEKDTIKEPHQLANAGAAAKLCNSVTSENGLSTASKTTFNAGGHGDQIVEQPGLRKTYSRLTASQIEFFRMVDEKIASGRDYESSSDER